MAAEREIRVGVRELRKDLSRYLRAAREGVSVLVTSHDEVVAELRAPPPETLPLRRPGRLRGKIWMAEDFETWPEDMFDAMGSRDH